MLAHSNPPPQSLHVPELAAGTASLHTCCLKHYAKKAEKCDGEMSVEGQGKERSGEQRRRGRNPDQVFWPSELNSD